MVILVVGASGATGRLLVDELLLRGHNVRAIVRSAETLPKQVVDENNLTVVIASILEHSDVELAQQVNNCDAVVSCLGHKLTVRGVFGSPRRLVRDAVHRLCDAIKSNASKNPKKFVLMNTAGNSNRDLHEPISFSQKCVIGLLRLLLPPHVDNEQAADYLRTKIGQDDSKIQWTVVRPDGLIDNDTATDYEVHPSPTRSAIFDAGQTSRINVSHFMADLITDDETWNMWKGRMPVIYNKTM